jgi:DNA-binding GntR family transcriptional regulator
MPLKKTELPRTAEEIAVTELRQAIVRGDLAPGATIKQSQTAQELGLSVIPVREALKTLASEGLVTYQSQRGYAVAELTSESIRSVFDVRNLLETEAERLAVARVGADDVAALRRAVQDQDAAADKGDAEAVIAANRRFHFVLFDLCGNPLLRRYVQQTWDTLEPYRVVSYRRGVARQDMKRHDRIQREHRAIADLLGKGDQEGALRVLAEHRAEGQTSFDDYLADAPTAESRA